MDIDASARTPVARAETITGFHTGLVCIGIAKHGALDGHLVAYSPVSTADVRYCIVHPGMPSSRSPTEE